MTKEDAKWLGEFLFRLSVMVGILVGTVATFIGTLALASRWMR